MKTKKLLSVVLIALMLLSCIPIFASAAEPIELIWYEHMTEFPIVSGDSFYFGQPVGNQTITGGKVVYNGEEVPGTFELIYSSDYVPTFWSAQGPYAPFKFTPDDTSSFIGFQLDEFLTYTSCLKTTPILASAPTVEGTVESGTRLRRVETTSPVLVNPYTNKEVEKNVGFEWANRATIIASSGWHEGTISAPGYEDITVKVYVRVTGDTEGVKIETAFSELPTIANTIYFGDSWSDLVVSGGKVIEDINGTEIQGTYKIGTSGTATKVGTQNITVVFMPNDDNYSAASVVLSVTVKPAPIKFVDADGNDIIPEITTIPGAVFGETLSIGYSLMAYMNSKSNSLEYFDMDGNSIDGTKVPIGTHTYQTRVTSKDTNFEPSMLTFVLTLEPTYFNVTTRYDHVNKYLIVVPDNKSISDEFDVWVDGELIGTTTGQKIKWATDESRDYAVTLVHKDTTEGVYALANTEYTMTVKIPREIFRSDSGLKFTTTGGTYPGNDNYAYKGDVLTLTCTDETFYNWQLSIGGEDWIPEGLTAEDLKKPTITFTMPDRDIFACPNDESRFAAAADCDHLCHSENPIYQFFWKILNFFFRLLNIQQYCDCGMLHYESAIFG